MHVRVVQVLVVRFSELELRTLTPVRECRHGNQAHLLRPTKHVPGIERQALATHTHTEREREREVLILESIADRLTSLTKSPCIAYHVS